MKPRLSFPAVQQTQNHRGSSKRVDGPHSSQTTTQPAALNLVIELCQSLDEDGIRYCHWKSNYALNRSACGKNDLDLLVSRSDADRFTQLLYRLGFKQAKAPVEKQMPGVLDYYGYDEDTDHLVHVHAHYQLVLGHDMTKNFRIPIEKPYLESAIQADLFKIPAPEFEFIVFVIRMALKHFAWDTILSRGGALKITEREELAFLQAQINQNSVNQVLKQHLPYISLENFNSCLQALQPGCPHWIRIKTGQRLQSILQANARRPVSVDTWLRLWRRAVLVIRRRVFKSSSKYCLANGGAVIAVVGGDGAGKSTAVDGLSEWLSDSFEMTRVHMGKPAWSWITITIRGILKIGQLIGLYPVEASIRETLRQKSLISPGFPLLVREVCRARDRYWTYVQARRFVANGGIVIFDRFPLLQIQLMDGPQGASFVSQLEENSPTSQFMRPHSTDWLVKFLVMQEENYYKQIVLPELLFVLRVEPETAVQRKIEEDPISIRERSAEIWAIDWEHTGAHVIDASKTKRDVLTELKATIWSEL